ncbi:MAG: hypothetical protein QS721_14805 [Candidatus Endonucleobacter sp. (ex Gigantidas childressi)]|nr:hypothetical protein [Candidatus Endonucleobacter sp. (ex Gigantidas childressi)]
MKKIKFCTAILATVLSGASMLSLAVLQPSKDSTHPFLVLETTGVTTLAFVVDEIGNESSNMRDMRLKVGIVAHDEEVPFVKLPEFEANDNKDMLRNFAWLNYDKDVCKPYFDCNAPFVKNMDLSSVIADHYNDDWATIFKLNEQEYFTDPIMVDVRALTSAEKRGSSEDNMGRIMTVGALFRATCESEVDAIEQLKNIFSLNADEARNTLRASNTLVRCNVSVVRLKNTSETYNFKMDFNRYNITLEVAEELISSDDCYSRSLEWCDIGVDITVAAPGCGIVSDVSGWAIEERADGTVLRSNTRVEGNIRITQNCGMNLFARLSLIGLNFKCVSHDRKHLGFGDVIDTRDHDRNNNSSVVFGLLSGSNDECYINGTSKANAWNRSLPGTLISRFTTLSAKTTEQVVDVVSKNGAADRDMAQQAGNALAAIGASESEAAALREAVMSVAVKIPVGLRGRVVKACMDAKSMRLQKE